MASKTSVCNEALFHLKNSKTLTDVDTDDSVQSRAFLMFYDDALREMYEEFEFPFSKTIEDLALVEDDPDDGAEWGHSYRRPSLCAKPRYIVDGNMAPSAISPRIAFEEGADSTGGLIFTDEDDAVLCYSKIITNVALMPGKFRKALSYKLAYLVAPTLCGEDRAGLGQKAFALYELEYSRAKAEALNTRQSGTPRESEFIEGR